MTFPTIAPSDWRTMFAAFRASGGVEGNVAWRQIRAKLSGAQGMANLARGRNPATVGAPDAPVSISRAEATGTYKRADGRHTRGAGLDFTVISMSYKVTLTKYNGATEQAPNTSPDIIFVQTFDDLDVAKFIRALNEKQRKRRVKAES